ncbi:MAG: hypothetical protein ACP5IC_00595, partial [Minisyncoccia bacterium]
MLYLQKLKTNYKKILNKKIITYALLFAIVISFINISYANALFGLGDIATNFVKKFIFFIGWIIAQLLAVFFRLAASFAIFTMTLNEQITSSPVVNVGWPVVRDLTNLGFVLALILIAYSTMLRIENYTAQKLLVKLIAAAILVNFSFYIGAFIINFSNNLGMFFMNQITGQGANASASGYEVAMNFLLDKIDPSNGLNANN